MAALFSSVSPSLFEALRRAYEAPHPMLYPLLRESGISAEAAGLALAQNEGELWLRPADIVDTSSKASAWNNAGIGDHWGNYAQSNAALRPTIISSDSDFNGYDSVDFISASSTSLVQTISTSPSAAEFFAVLKADNDPGVGVSSEGAWLFGSETSGTLYPHTDSTVYDGVGSTVRKVVGNPTASLASTHVYHVTTASGDWEAWVNDESVHSTGTNTVGWGTSQVLGRNANISRFFDGKMAEVLIIPRQLSAVERTQVKAYLYDKYAITP